MIHECIKHRISRMQSVSITPQPRQTMLKGKHGFCLGFISHQRFCSVPCQINVKKEQFKDRLDWSFCSRSLHLFCGKRPVETGKLGLE